MKAKQRSHNEHFRPVSLGGRKSCPQCHAKLGAGESVWSWGEYAYAKWRTVLHFCKECFPEEVKARLKGHAGGCGCLIVCKAYGGGVLPPWLQL